MRKVRLLRDIGGCFICLRLARILLKFCNLQPRKGEVSGGKVEQKEWEMVRAWLFDQFSQQVFLQNLIRNIARTLLQYFLFSAKRENSFKLILTFRQSRLEMKV